MNETKKLIDEPIKNNQNSIENIIENVQLSSPSGKCFYLFKLTNQL